MNRDKGLDQRNKVPEQGPTADRVRALLEQLKRDPSKLAVQERVILYQQILEEFESRAGQGSDRHGESRELARLALPQVTQILEDILARHPSTKEVAAEVVSIGEPPAPSSNLETRVNERSLSNPVPGIGTILKRSLKFFGLVSGAVMLPVAVSALALRKLLPARHPGETQPSRNGQKAFEADNKGAALLKRLGLPKFGWLVNFIRKLEERSIGRIYNEPGLGFDSFAAYEAVVVTPDGVETSLKKWLEGCKNGANDAEISAAIADIFVKAEVPVQTTNRTSAQAVTTIPVLPGPNTLPLNNYQELVEIDFYPPLATTPTITAEICRVGGFTVQIPPGVTSVKYKTKPKQSGTQVALDPQTGQTLLAYLPKEAVTYDPVMRRYLQLVKASTISFQDKLDLLVQDRSGRGTLIYCDSPDINQVLRACPHPLDLVNRTGLGACFEYAMLLASDLKQAAIAAITVRGHSVHKGRILTTGHMITVAIVGDRDMARDLTELAAKLSNEGSYQDEFRERFRDYPLATHADIQTFAKEALQYLQVYLEAEPDKVPVSDLYLTAAHQIWESWARPALAQGSITETLQIADDLGKVLRFKEAIHRDVFSALEQHHARYGASMDLTTVIEVLSSEIFPRLALGREANACLYFMRSELPRQLPFNNCLALATTIEVCSRTTNSAAQCADVRLAAATMLAKHSSASLTEDQKPRVGSLIADLCKPIDFKGPSSLREPWLARVNSATAHAVYVLLTRYPDRFPAACIEILQNTALHIPPLKELLSAKLSGSQNNREELLNEVRRGLIALFRSAPLRAMHVAITLAQEFPEVKLTPLDSKVQRTTFARVTKMIRIAPVVAPSSPLADFVGALRANPGMALLPEFLDAMMKLGLIQDDARLELKVRPWRDSTICKHLFGPLRTPHDINEQDRVGGEVAIPVAVLLNTDPSTQPASLCRAAIEALEEYWALSANHPKSKAQIHQTLRRRLEAFEEDLAHRAGVYAECYRWAHYRLLEGVDAAFLGYLQYAFHRGGSFSSSNSCPFRFSTAEAQLQSKTEAAHQSISLIEDGMWDNITYTPTPDSKARYPYPFYAQLGFPQATRTLFPCLPLRGMWGFVFAQVEPLVAEELFKTAALIPSRQHPHAANHITGWNARIAQYGLKTPLTQSGTFEALRPYEVGDPLQRIDQKAYGRSDRLLTRWYREQATKPAIVLVDLEWLANEVPKWLVFGRAPRVQLLLSHIERLRESTSAAKVVFHFRGRNVSISEKKEVPFSETLSAIWWRAQPEILSPETNEILSLAYAVFKYIDAEREMGITRFPWSTKLAAKDVGLKNIPKEGHVYLFNDPANDAYTTVFQAAARRRHATIIRVTGAQAKNPGGGST